MEPKAKLTSQRELQSEIRRILARAAELKRLGHYREALEELTANDSSTSLRRNLPLLKAKAELLDLLGESKSFFRLLQEIKDLRPQAHFPYILAYNYFHRRRQFETAIKELNTCPLEPQTPAIKAHILYASARHRIYSKYHQLRRTFSAPAAGDPASGLSRGLAICMMIRDESDIIHANLAHHYKLGCRRFFLMDHLSSDQTMDIVNDFADKHPDAVIVVIADRHEGFYQADKTRALCAFARHYLEPMKDKLTLILPLDADEFLDLPPGRNVHWLLEQFEASGADALVFHLANAGNSQAIPFNPQKHTIYDLIDKVEACEGDIITKNAFRPRLIDGIGMGNHVIRHSDLKNESLLCGIDLGVRLVHFKYRSPSHVLSKIVNGCQALAATELPAGICSHWRAFYHEMKLRGEHVVASEIFKSYCADVCRYSDLINPNNF